MVRQQAPRWLSADQQRVWRAYLLGSALLQERIDADLRSVGLDGAEYEILVNLSEAPDRRLRMAELADAVHQSRSRLTHTITRMEKARLVERISCPTDRRGVWADLDRRRRRAARGSGTEPRRDRAPQLRRGDVARGLRCGGPGVCGGHRRRAAADVAQAS